MLGRWSRPGQRPSYRAVMSAVGAVFMIMCSTADGAREISKIQEITELQNERG